MNDKILNPQNELMRNYYRFQSKIYDATRWSFLFGRKKILRLFSVEKAPKHIVEIGCGTGHNLKQLATFFPTSKITGIDVSADMLSICKKKFVENKNITLLEKAYGNQVILFQEQPDLILFSYALSMINPEWTQILEQAKNDLKNGGMIAIVDFHSTRFNWFKNHMANNHVRMEGHMDQVLQSSFTSKHFEVKSAYGGLWNYFYFVGIKSGQVKK